MRLPYIDATQPSRNPPLQVCRFSWNSTLHVELSHLHGSWNHPFLFRRQIGLAVRVQWDERVSAFVQKYFRESRSIHVCSLRTVLMLPLVDTLHRVQRPMCLTKAEHNNTACTTWVIGKGKKRGKLSGSQRPDESDWTQKALKFARTLQISTEGRLGAVGDLVSKHLNGGWSWISACMWVRYESTPRS